MLQEPLVVAGEVRAPAAIELVELLELDPPEGRRELRRLEVPDERFLEDEDVVVSEAVDGRAEPVALPAFASEQVALRATPPATLHQAAIVELRVVEGDQAPAPAAVIE